MSLIVARQVGDSIFLISDTKLTSKNDDRLSSSLDEHILKTVIINPQLVFAFAGNVDDAEDVLRRISLISNKSEIEAVIYSAHLSSLQDGEFKLECILAFGNPIFQLIEFKSGVQNNVSNTWIGSQEGFELFQKFYHDGVTIVEKKESDKVPVIVNRDLNAENPERKPDQYPDESIEQSLSFSQN